MESSPLTPGFGALVGGPDLRTLNDAQAEEMSTILAREGLLLFREQNLSNDDLLRLGNTLGTVDPSCNPIATRLTDGKVLYFSNQTDESNLPVGSLSDVPLPWHTDNYHRNEPCVSLLHGLQLPERGGDTHFCNMRLAFEALPKGLRRKAETWTGLYETPPGYLKHHPEFPPEIRLPLLWNLPVENRRSLYVSEYTKRIDVLSPRKSARVLAKLLRLATSAERIYVHSWQVGDVLFWDNAQIIHRRDGFTGKRMMKALRINSPTRHFAAPAPI